MVKDAQAPRLLGPDCPGITIPGMDSIDCLPVFEQAPLSEAIIMAGDESGDAGAADAAAPVADSSDRVLCKNPG